MSSLTPDYQRRVLREQLRTAVSPPTSTTTTMQEAAHDWYMPDTGIEETGMLVETTEDISTEALRWFNRGLIWTWGFNNEEAVVCFEMALEASPSFAMAHWGIATSHGPYYNVAGRKFMQVAADAKQTGSVPSIPASLAHAEAAHLHKASLSPLHAALVEAMLLRCRGFASLPEHAEPQAHFEQVELAYAVALRPLTIRFPEAAITHALLAQALMLQAPWLLWGPTDSTPRGLRKPACAHTLEIEQVLADGLALAPRHPLCWLQLSPCHKHGSSQNPTTVATLDIWCTNLRLSLTQRPTHCCCQNHMAAHIFGQVGEYSEAIEAGLLAVASDEHMTEVGCVGKLVEKEGLYHRKGAARSGFAHNLHKLMFDAMCANNEAVANDALHKLTSGITYEHIVANPTRIEPFGLMKYHCWIRFGHWDTILEQPLETDLPLMATTYANQRYARGVALAAKGLVREADVEFAALVDALEMPILQDNGALSARKVHNIPEIVKLRVAVELLRGEIAYRRGDTELAFDTLRLAVHLDDNLPFDEPAGWMVPARHALGALLLESGHKELARETYNEDLRMNPNNVWALTGLVECLEGAADGTPEAAQLEAAHAELEVQATKTGVQAPTASCACALTKWSRAIATPVAACCHSG